MWPKLQFPAEWVTFTEEILNGKLHFLFSAIETFWNNYSFLRIWVTFTEEILWNESTIAKCERDIYFKWIPLNDTSNITDQKNLHYLHRNFKLIHESFVSHGWASLFAKINKNHVWPELWICYLQILLILST